MTFEMLFKDFEGVKQTRLVLKSTMPIFSDRFTINAFLFLYLYLFLFLYSKREGSLLYMYNMYIIVFYIVWPKNYSFRFCFCFVFSLYSFCTYQNKKILLYSRFFFCKLKFFCAIYYLFFYLRYSYIQLIVFILI